MAKVTNPDGSCVEFIYNAAGQRVEKIVKNPAGTVTADTKYQYDNASGNLLREIDALTNTTKDVYDSLGRLYSQEQGGSTYYYNYDGHGNVVSITDWWGSTVESYKYDPWGKLVSKTGTLYNPITYSGYYYDEETGLYYLINRYYDPVDGRFLSRDAYQDIERVPATINPYIYALNDPVNYTDPDGNFVFVPLLLGGAAVSEWVITAVWVAAGIATGVIIASDIDATPDTHPDMFDKLKGNQGHRHKETGEIWKKDKLHKDHYDVSNPRTGKKVKEVDF
nr:RHS repeat-associated core domain-containing protein [Clostridia bacterium]